MFKHIEINADDVTWNATLKQWKEDAKSLGDEGVFLISDIEQRLCWIQKITKDTNNQDMYGYFLVKKGDAYASSLMEISHALPKTKKSWLKLLEITLRPALLPRDGISGDLMKEAFLVLSNSIACAINLIFDEHPSSKLKIYGRTNEMQSLFANILVNSKKLEKELSNFGLSIGLEGKWLLVAKKD
jgi:hypothetical protein